MKKNLEHNGIQDWDKTKRCSKTGATEISFSASKWQILFFKGIVLFTIFFTCKQLKQNCPWCVLTTRTCRFQSQIQCTRSDQDPTIRSFNSQNIMLCLSRFVETKEQELSVFSDTGKCDQNKICIYSKHARNNQIIF